MRMMVSPSANQPIPKPDKPRPAKSGGEPARAGAKTLPVSADAGKAE